ncbi:hypothetical protein [Streptomyces sp. NPDC060001]|uniref:hypothetical protein n=1 Tax=Streptomyces sp. NPDC060001 TaxID=3347032 RepID=UPI0036CC7AE8
MSITAQPRTVTDNDGDVWRLNDESGMYESRGLFDRTLDEIRREYGPLKTDSEDVRTVIADVLEEIARKLREV